MLAIYTPGVDTATLDTIIGDVNAYFCSILPLKLEMREMILEPYQITTTSGYNRIYTNVLNVQELYIDNELIPCEVTGRKKNVVTFEYPIAFDPSFTCEVLSGYETLPADIQQAMIEYAKDKVLNIGMQSNISSYALGPRKVTFEGKQSVQKLLSRYM